MSGSSSVAEGSRVIHLLLVITVRTTIPAQVSRTAQTPPETSGKLFSALMIPKIAGLRFIKQREK
jgi:hypothetical protein